MKNTKRLEADSNNTGGSGSTKTGGNVYPEKCMECRALTWWNRNVQTLGLANANQIPWSNVKAMMTTEYCPATEIQRMEQELWTLTLKGDDIEAYNNRFHELAFDGVMKLEPDMKRRILKGHFKDKCPKAGNRQNDGARGRAYVVVENPQQNPNVVTATNPSKLDVRTERPLNRQLNQFISQDWRGYYSKFIENFFLQDRKAPHPEKLCNAPMLALPDGPDDFVVNCDASKPVIVGASQIAAGAKVPESFSHTEQDLGATREYAFGTRLCRLEIDQVGSLSLPIHEDYKRRNYQRFIP
ncbi:putative reverse transcriptase domain-containing protein [Tanacetum coccineum]